MAAAPAPQGGSILGRMVPSSGFQLTVGGKAERLATDTNDITG